MCLCDMQVIRGYFSRGLSGPPTEALSSKQQMEKERRGEISPQERLLPFSVSSIFHLTIKPEHFNKQSTLRSTSNVKTKCHLPFNCLGSWQISQVCVCVCACINTFLPEYRRRPGQFTSTDVPTTLPKPQWLNNS